MDVGLHDDRLQVPARVVKADAVVGDVEGPADLAEGVEEGGHVALVGAVHEEVAAGGQGGRGPESGLDAVGQGGVVACVRCIMT